MSLTEKPTSPDITKWAHHLVLALWIPYSKINLQLEKHFLLSAVEEVSPVRLFSWWWCWLMRVWSEGWCWQLSSSKAFVKILLRGRFEQLAAHRNTSTMGISLISSLLCLPAGYMSNYCTWQATFSLTFINNREWIYQMYSYSLSERTVLSWNHMAVHIQLVSVLQGWVCWYIFFPKNVGYTFVWVAFAKNYSTELF